MVISPLKKMDVFIPNRILEVEQMTYPGDYESISDCIKYIHPFLS